MIKIGPLVFPDDAFFNEHTLVEYMEKSYGLAKTPFTVTLLDAKGRTLERAFTGDEVEAWLSKGIKDSTMVTYLIGISFA